MTLLFALDESGRFSGYAEVTSDVGSVPSMAWMEEHCTPVGAAFEVRHRTRYIPFTFFSLVSQSNQADSGMTCGPQQQQKHETCSKMANPFALDKMDKKSPPKKLLW